MSHLSQATFLLAWRESGAVPAPSAIADVPGVAGKLLRKKQECQKHTTEYCNMPTAAVNLLRGSNGS
jgi:hypothetical protein